MARIGPKRAQRTFDQIRFEKLQNKRRMPMPSAEDAEEKKGKLKGRIKKKTEGEVMVYFKSGGIITRKESSPEESDIMKMMEEVFNTPFAQEGNHLVSIEPLSQKKAENIKESLEKILQNNIAEVKKTEEGHELHLDYHAFLIAVKTKGIKDVYSELSRLEMVHKHGPGVITFLNNALKFIGKEPQNHVYLKNDGSLDLEGGENMTYDQILELAQKQLLRNSFES